MWTTGIIFFDTFSIKKQLPWFYIESSPVFLGKCNKQIPGIGTDSML